MIDVNKSRFTSAKQDERCHSEVCNHNPIPFGHDYLLYAAYWSGSYVRVCMNCVHRTINSVPLTYVYDCEAVREYMEDLDQLQAGGAK